MVLVTWFVLGIMYTRLNSVCYIVSSASTLVSTGRRVSINYLKEQTLYKLKVKIYSVNDPTSSIRACVETLNKKNSITITYGIIVNRDLEEEPAPTGETSAPSAPKTAKQLAARRNQERVKSILLLEIPDEYLFKFHNVADAKSLWEAVKSRFGGNEESKKMQKFFLKHQFENFSTASNESLDKAYDRFQKLISQWEAVKSRFGGNEESKKMQKNVLKHQFENIST
ncbi:hypothetical protein Tco_1034506, partial [Tanacetum coccineum]